MPIQINWLDDGYTILQVRYHMQWDMVAYHRMIERTSVLIAQQHHIVHVLHDFQQSISVPRDFLIGIRHASKWLPANRGLQIYIQAAPVMKAYLLMAKRGGLSIATQSYQADSLSDAERIIHKRAHHLRGA